MSNATTTTINTLALATAIAAEFGEGWTASARKNQYDESLVEVNPNAVVNGPGGKGFHVTTLHVEAGKAHVYGIYPKGYNGTATEQLTKRYNEALPSINFALTKSAKAAAADIKRRFMPEYEAMHALCVSRNENDKQYEHALAINVNAVGEALGMTVRKCREDFYLPSESGFHGDVKPGSSDIKIEVTVPVELGLRICAMLREHSDKCKAMAEAKELADGIAAHGSEAAYRAHLAELEAFLAEELAKRSAEDAT